MNVFDQMNTHLAEQQGAQLAATVRGVLDEYGLDQRRPEVGHVIAQQLRQADGSDPAAVAATLAAVIGGTLTSCGADYDPGWLTAAVDRHLAAAWQQQWGTP